MQAIVRKLGAGIEPLADQIMTVLLTLIQSSKTSTVLEDAFLVVGTMAACALTLHIHWNMKLTVFGFSP